MPRPHHGFHGHVTAQSLCMTILGHIGHGAHHGVDIPVFEFFRPSVGQVPHLHLSQGRDLRNERNAGRQEVSTVIRAGDAEGAGDFGGSKNFVFEKKFVLFQKRLHMRYGALRPPIRNQSRRRPGEKFIPERLSKFAQHSGCRRRRNTERIGGRRKIAGFAERAEKDEQISVECFGHMGILRR